MKERAFFAGLCLVFAAQIVFLAIFAVRPAESAQDAVAVNEAVQTVQRDWNAMETHTNAAGLEYVVLRAGGEVLYRTRPGLSESIHAAITHRDTILDIESGGVPVGKLIVYSGEEQRFQTEKRVVVLTAAAGILLQLCICAAYFLYLRHAMVTPFHRLERFAQRIAGGDLDIPLQMDRHNLFGAFTESFDLMRCELKKARQMEAKADAAKKELVAKLSHDIRTPVASIKAVSELGAATAAHDRDRENYGQIVQKADQIDTLMTNLFSATMEELHELSVTPSELKSREVCTLLANADYRHLAKLPAVPDCLLLADGLRLQQVFDNLFSNSYKYAGTEIDVTAELDGEFLAICVEDSGGGVPEAELPYLKEKFRRGSNTKGREGAGLGLYICDHCMKNMGGRLILENGPSGLRAVVQIALSREA